MEGWCLTSVVNAQEVPHWPPVHHRVAHIHTPCSYRQFSILVNLTCDYRLEKKWCTQNNNHNKKRKKGKKTPPMNIENMQTSNRGTAARVQTSNFLCCEPTVLTMTLKPIVTLICNFLSHFSSASPDSSYCMLQVHYSLYHTSDNLMFHWAHNESIHCFYLSRVRKNKQRKWI